MNLFLLGNKFTEALADTWYSIWLSLNDMVYRIIELLYKVFMAVTNVNLFSDEAFDKITSRVYIVMAIAMLFIFAYNIILMIINPDDKKSTGQTTQFVKDVVISLVLIILLPVIFNYMAVLQRHILNSNIIGQIIISDTGGTEENCDYSEYTILNNAGIDSTSNVTDNLNQQCQYYITRSPAERGASSIAPTLFSAFYHPTKFGFYECKSYLESCKGNQGCYNNDITDESEEKMCAFYFYDITLARYTGTLKPFSDDANFYNKVRREDDSFEFNYLLAFVAGILAVYMFVCYTIAIGVRVAKLGFLQILSPIAVMMRMIPKQKDAFFDKWVKQLTSTYFDVFIRLVIIYFSLFAISLVPDVINSLLNAFDGSFLVKALAIVVVILGILKFALDAPALIKEFIGDTGRFKLESPKKQLESNKLAMAGMGMAAGGFTTMAGNAYNAFKHLNDDDAKGRKPGTLRKVGRALGGVTSIAGGLVGGARYGAQEGYKSDSFEALESGIESAKYKADKARGDRDAIHKKGAINGYDIPILSSAVGHAKDLKENIGDALKDYGGLISGTGASNERGVAIDQSLSKVSSIFDQFKNALVDSIINSQGKMNEDFRNNRDIKPDGIEYTRSDRGWVRKDDPNGQALSDTQMGDKIKEYFDGLKKQAYISNFTKSDIDKDTFKRMSDDMIKTLGDNISKFGDRFTKDLYNTLNDPNGLNLNVDSIDGLASKMSELQSNEQWDVLYDINDSMEKSLKSYKRNNVVEMNKNSNKDKKE